MSERPWEPSVSLIPEVKPTGAFNTYVVPFDMPFFIAFTVDGNCRTINIEADACTGYATLQDATISERVEVEKCGDTVYIFECRPRRRIHTHGVEVEDIPQT